MQYGLAAVATMTSSPDPFRPADSFRARHLAPRAADVAAMLGTIGVPDLGTLIDETIPGPIRYEGKVLLPK